MYGDKIYRLCTNLYNINGWRIMANFQTLNCWWSSKMQGMWLKFCKTLVTRYTLPFYQSLSQLNCTYSKKYAIFNQCLSAMLLWHQILVHTISYQECTATKKSVCLIHYPSALFTPVKDLQNFTQISVLSIIIKLKTRFLKVTSI